MSKVLITKLFVSEPNPKKSNKAWAFVDFVGEDGAVKQIIMPGEKAGEIGILPAMVSQPFKNKILVLDADFGFDGRPSAVRVAK